MNQETIDAIQQENQALLARLAEAEDALRAIRSGEVDALVVYGVEGEQVYTLQGAEHAYRVMVESISEGAATLLADGTLLYCNHHLAEMLNHSLETLPGSHFSQYISVQDRETVERLLEEGLRRNSRAEISFQTTMGESLPVLLSVSPTQIDDRRGLCLIATDLTIQKRDEEILANERLARSILDQAAEAIVVCDLEGTVIRASQVACQINGQTALFHPFEKAFPFIQVNSHSEESPFSIRPVLQGETFRGVQARLGNRQGGSSQIFLINAAPLHNHSEEIIGCVVTLTDLTERNQVETFRAALNEINRILLSTMDTKEMLQGAISAAARVMGSETAALSLKNEDGWVVSHVYGFPSEVIGMHMVDDQERHAILALQTKLPVAVTDTHTDERVNREHLQKWGIRSVLAVPILVRDEAIGAIFFNYYGSPVEFKQAHLDFATQLAGSISLALDGANLFQNLEKEIAERKKTEMILQKANEQLRFFLESITDAYMEFDEQMRWVVINPVAERTFFRERPAKELIGKVIWDEFPGAMNNEIYRHYQEAKASGLPVHFDAYMPRLERWLEMHIYPRNGHLYVYSRDITERKQAEEEAIHSRAQAELQHRLIDQREKERQQIARDLHDGPVQELTAITLDLQSAILDATNPTDIKNLSALRDALQKQIGDLRTYSGELRPPALFQFGLVRAIQSHLDDFRRAHPGLTIHFDEQQSLPIMPTDVRLAIYRIYQEALTNIAKHSQATDVWIQFKQDPLHVELMIEDNGKGFSPPSDWLELARHGHLGLVGLQERAEAIGGTTQISSIIGRGTTINVSVPITVKEKAG